VEISRSDAIPSGSVPNARRVWPHTIFPLYALIVGANDDFRCGSTFDPFDQAQQEAVIRIVESVRADAQQRALPHLPGSGSAETMTHAGNDEETIKVIQIT